MPYQVSWQSVSIKSQRPVHVLAAAARASTPQHAPAAARIVTANMPSFVTAAPLPRLWTILTWKMTITRHVINLDEKFGSEWLPGHTWQTRSRGVWAMTRLPRGLKVHLALGYTDRRKGIDVLAMAPP